MSGYSNNSIFWVETEKIQPNPFQPRREFEPNALADLADSIRQYGVLQPLVVTRKEEYRNDGGMEVSYELIAGERRLRAAKLAGLQQVPVIIRQETDEKVKLELAIIENLQREDLNPIDRALAFEQLYKQFSLTHSEIGKKMGKSRVYVSNTLRLLALPDDIKKALTDGKITEGHTRPLLMLTDRPEEQLTLFREIIVKNMSVRDAEKIARKVAQDKIRKKQFEIDPKIRVYEKKMSENLGTRVHIEPKEKGGKIVIDYFTLQDLDTILDLINKSESKDAERMMNQFMQQKVESTSDTDDQQQEDLSHSTAVSFEDSSQEPDTDTDEPETTVEEQAEDSQVSDFLTGNPYKEDEPQESPNTVPTQQPVTNQIPKEEEEQQAVSTPEPPSASELYKRDVQNSNEHEHEEAPVTTTEEESPVVAPSKQEPVNQPTEPLSEGSVPTDAYPQGDPYLEEPTVATPKKDINNYGQVDNRTTPQPREYTSSQAPENPSSQYSQNHSSQYGNVTYRQKPQKKGFLKKIFG